MRKFRFLAFTASSFLIFSSAAAQNSKDVEKYIKDHDWQPYEAKIQARSNVSNLSPLLYYANEASTSGCGILTPTPGSNKLRFIELLASSSESNFPECLNIVSITPFKLKKTEIVAIEYLVQDTREDFYKYFHYVYRDPSKGYLTDNSLTGKITPLRNDGPVASKTTNNDGIKAARGYYLSTLHPNWALSKRDFISDENGSFGIFKDKKSQQCYLVTESGAEPVVTVFSDIFPQERCIDVLASSRFNKEGKIFYMAIFKADNGKQVVAVTSVGSGDKIMAEKMLSEVVTKAGATRDIKSAKAALASALR